MEGSYIPQERILLALKLLIEGNSRLRSTQRISGLDLNTVIKILVKAGENTKTHGSHNRQLRRNLGIRPEKEGHKGRAKLKTKALETPTVLSRSSGIRNSI